MIHFVIAAPDGSHLLSVGHMPDGVAAEFLESIGATPITAEQFALARPDPGAWRMTEDGLVPSLPPPRDLEQERAKALILVDQQAEFARLRFLTPGAGQALEYEATKQDATRLLAANHEPIASDYPWLAAEQAALGSVGLGRSLREIAEAVQSQMDAWTTAGAGVKEVRRAAKLQLSGATTVAEVDTIMAGLSWPAPA